MRRLAVATTSRADYGLYRPLLERIAAHRQFELHIIAGGAHLTDGTIEHIRRDGYAIADTVDCLLASDGDAAVPAGMGLAVAGFGRALARLRPDFLLVLGDRFEMHAAALAALPLRIAVGHIHGGELTMGAMDDALRHSMTKLSHLHFVAAEPYARRVRQLGEPADRVFNTGALGVDHLMQTPRMDRDEIRREYGIDLPEGVLLATFHPATLDAMPPQQQVEQVLGALADSGRPVVFTRANADPGGRRINAMVDAFVAAREEAQVADNLGPGFYFNAMRLAAAMVGNSSSGLIEAPSCPVAVVNIGPREDGRLRAGNVIDTPCEREAIGRALDSALDPAFTAALGDVVNPCGDGRAAQRIVEALAASPPPRELLVKRFIDHREQNDG